MKTIIVLIIFTIVIIGCDPVDDRLTIINNFDKNIIVSPNIFSNDSSKYSDFKHFVGEADFNENKIFPISKRKILIKGNWDSYFKKDTLLILIFDEDEILKQGYHNSIEYRYLKKVKVSHKYLEDNDWKITIDSTSINKF